MLAITIAAVAAAPAPAASLSADSTALLSGNTSLAAPFAAPVDLARIGPNSISADGRYAAFISTSDGLLAGDDDRSYNVYRKDMETGEVVLVSRRSGVNGEASRGYCYDTTISDDGLRVAFACVQPLDGADQNGHADVYVRDVPTATTMLVSRVDETGPAGNDTSDDPALSYNGDYVAFRSYASDLVSGEQGERVYRRHLPSQETVLVARLNGAAGAGADGEEPSITDDGKLVAFVSSDAIDSTADKNFTRDVYLRDVGAGTTTLVSRLAGSTGAAGNGASSAPEISGNGLGVVFVSNATNLDARDTASDPNVYRRSLGFSRTDLIDVNAAGAKSGQSAYPSIDQSSHLIAFVSTATGLDPADTDPNPDVYMKNIAANTVELASRASGQDGAAANRDAVVAAISGDGLTVASGLQRGGITADSDPRREMVIHRDLSTYATRSVARPSGSDPFVNEGGHSQPASLSADGLYAAFVSDAAGLGLPQGPRNGVFVRDRVTGSVTLASRADGPGGAPFARVFDTPSLSADGHRVAFTAVENEGEVRQVWVRDLVEGRTFLASRAVGAGGAPGDNESRDAALDSDGSRVVFQSRAKNLVSGDSDEFEDVYVRDLASGDTILVSRADGAAGQKGNDTSVEPDIDASGTRVAFRSGATNLVAGDSDNQYDLFLRDLGAGTTRLVNATPAGTKGNDYVSDPPSIDAAGNRVAFVSAATNLGDGSPDEKVFVRDFAANTLTVAEKGHNAVISPDGGYVAFEDDGNGVQRHDLFTRQTELVSRRGGPGGAPATQEANVGDISANGACVSFGTDDALVGDPHDSAESYLRVFTADCGDAAGGGTDDGGSGTPGAGDPGVTPATGGPGATPLDKVAPVLSGARLSQQRFRVALAATPVAATVRRGTVLTFRSSEAGTLRVAIQRVRRGARPRAAGTLTRRIAAGRSRIRLSGRIGRRALRPGNYRLRLTAVDAARNRSVPSVLRFRVVR